ncbi:hypothetical protein JTB14_004155 [Gonioctena quinquepunctata]|nr:hypothetical protein JTB14_004155 [Gonioctena quinquepunctata]
MNNFVTILNLACLVIPFCVSIRKIRMKPLSILAAVMLFSIANASTDREQWMSFKHTHGRTFKSLAEDRTRYGIFQSNLRKIEEHNARYNSGEVTYYMGITPFTDMTHEEFKDMLRLQKATRPVLNANSHVFVEGLDLPESMNWTERGAVTAVKTQGECASCWAFSATGAIEGQNAIINELRTPLSEQQLLDCSGSYGNGNCARGGNVTNAFDYIKDNGIQSESDYPYETQQRSCRYSAEKTLLKIKGYNTITDENVLQQVVGTIGPVSVGVNADLLQHYQGGIFHDIFCSHETNHAVLATGYGNNGMLIKTNHWILKNSWGPGWGELGYFRMSRGINMCGISQDGSYPILN